MELSGFELHFTRANAIKCQALANFVTALTEVPLLEEEPIYYLPGKEDPRCWVM
jgi:hypothetical protein